MSSLYTEWLARVVPPRASNVRAVAVNATSQAIELDNDVFQFAPGGGGGGRPGDYGRGLLVLQPEGCDMYVVFGSTSGVVANSAATAGPTVAAYLPQLAGGNSNDGYVFEVSPTLDKFVAVASKNGGATTGTLRYWVRSNPMQQGGSGQGGA